MRKLIGALTIVACNLIACAHSPNNLPSPPMASDLNFNRDLASQNSDQGTVRVYRIFVGRKSDPVPVYSESDLSRDRAEAIREKAILGDRAFQRSHFYNGCYLFSYTKAENSTNSISMDEAVTNREQRNPAEAPNWQKYFCYQSSENSWTAL